MEWLRWGDWIVFVCWRRGFVVERRLLWDRWFVRVAVGLRKMLRMRLRKSVDVMLLW